MENKKCEECLVGKLTKKKPKFCSLNCYWSWKRRTPHVGAYKGKVKSMGYIYLYMPNHPNAISSKRYIAEHRYVMEQKVRRYLERHEVVHHVNGNKQDNRIENLELLTNVSHSTQHGSEKYIPVKQVDLSGKTVAVFDSITNASKSTGIRKSGISSCTTGRSKTAGGFMWKIKLK